MITLKNIIFITIATFLLTGCNIYRQMTIPTPYYPEGNSGIVDGGLGQSVPVVNQKQPQDMLENENNNNTVKPLKKDSVKTTDSTVMNRIPFPVDEYVTLPKKGSAKISGDIYLTTSGGNKVLGKETRLYLNPVTSYSTQWFNESYMGGAKMSKVDSRLFNYLKFTTSDANGKFDFINIPSGSYYLIGVVKCGSQCGYSKVRTIRIAKKVSVFGSEKKKLDLTKTIN